MGPLRGGTLLSFLGFNLPLYPQHLLLRLLLLSHGLYLLVNPEEPLVERDLLLLHQLKHLLRVDLHSELRVPLRVQDLDREDKEAEVFLLWARLEFGWRLLRGV